jgi:hypothetical protein
MPAFYHKPAVEEKGCEESSHGEVEVWRGILYVLPLPVIWNLGMRHQMDQLRRNCSASSLRFSASRYRRMITGVSEHRTMEQIPPISTSGYQTRYGCWIATAVRPAKSSVIPKAINKKSAARTAVRPLPRDTRNPTAAPNLCWIALDVTGLAAAFAFAVILAGTVVLVGVFSEQYRSLSVLLFAADNQYSTGDHDRRAD